MENTNKLTNLVQDAQIILAKHLEPLGPTEKQTLQDLYQLLDGPRSREAIAAAPVQAQEPVSDTALINSFMLPADHGHPAEIDPTDPRDCTCPSGDGSLNWPCTVHPPVPHWTDTEGVKAFYQMDGQPCPPDIEDELGQLLLACDKAIEFLTAGPAIEVTEDVIQAMYESNVVKLIPKLKAVLESRVSVKYPFAMLASIHGSRITEPGFAPIDHLIAATGAIEISNDRMMQNFENYTANIDTLNIGPNTMPYLADMVIHMQRIMTTFGWTWDDVKLKARQQMAEHE